MSPECFTDIGKHLDIHGLFDFTLNTTACADGTFCLNPNNQTCCFNQQGNKLISYHYYAALPTAATALSTFYAENGYQITNITSSSSNILPTTSPSSPLSSFPSTSSPTSAYISTSPTSTYISTSPTDRNPPSRLDTASKASIGIGAVVGTLFIAGIVILLLYRKRRLRQENGKHPGILEAIETAPPDRGQWEKPELIGEDARKEMESEGRRLPELHGEGARVEMGTANLRHMMVSELHG